MFRPMMSLAIPLLVLSGLLLRGGTLQAQTATQGTAQTGAQTAAPSTAQTGPQTGTQTATRNAAQSTAQGTAPANAYKLIPLPMPTLSPGTIELVKLEGEFEKAVEKDGGKGFASWFAEDGMTLNNGKPAVLGRRAIAAQATWDPKDYQLTWYAEGAQMGPAGDTGFTWGHYEGVSHDAKGQPTTVSGRYITFWKKVHGEWKVALDASADDVPASAAAPQP